MELGGELDNRVFTHLPRDGIGVFEAVVYQERQLPKISSQELSESKFVEWLHKKDLATQTNEGAGAIPVMGLIHLVHLPETKNPFEVRMGREVWAELSASFGLHPLTPRSIIDNHGCTATYHTTDARTGVLKSTSVVVKVPRKVLVGYHALSLTYDYQTRRVTALFHGFPRRDWTQLRRQLVEELNDFIHVSLHPMYIPTLFFILYRQIAEDYRVTVDNNILLTERETGYGVAGRLITSANVKLAKASHQPIDFESLLRRLYSYQTELSTIGNISRFIIGYCRFLTEGLDDVERLCHSDDDTAAGTGVARSLLQFHRSNAQLTESQIQSLRERVQSQTNLVFGLISQNENKISRQVAEESAKIALATRRDGNAMKTIALMTLLFLPATFVSAFLSMPFFDWGPNSSNGSPTASRFLWVYFLITLPLTAILLVGWALWTRRDENRLRLEGETAKEKLV